MFSLKKKKVLRRSGNLNFHNFQGRGFWGLSQSLRDSEDVRTTHDAEREKNKPKNNGKLLDKSLSFFFTSLPIQNRARNGKKSFFYVLHYSLPHFVTHFLFRNINSFSLHFETLHASWKVKKLKWLCQSSRFSGDGKQCVGIDVEKNCKLGNSGNCILP